MMDKVENDVTEFNTNSNLSEWVGPRAMCMTTTREARNINTAAVSDRLDWCDRLFSVAEVECSPGGFDIGPSTNPTGTYNFTLPFRSIEVLKFASQKYFGVSWSAIEIRMTVADPKNLSGGFFVGWLPWQDQYDETQALSFAKIFNDDLLFQNLVNGPYTRLSLFGNSEDITITIPWTFKYSFLPVYAMMQADDVAFRAATGAPTLWWKLAPGTTYTTSVQKPARLNIFFQYKGLQWYGPTNQELPVAEQQASVVGGAVAEMAAAVAVSTGIDAVTTDVLSAMLPNDEIEEDADMGTYDLPAAVQLAYLGDTTSCTYPNTTQIFKKVRKATNDTPTVKEMLKRPQYVGYGLSSDSDPIYFGNDPLSFYWRDDVGPSSVTLYGKAHLFRWFGMVNRYWRGTILCHIVVAGHPMVQSQLDVRVSYPRYEANGCQVMSDVFRHLETFNSSKQIVVPLPYLTSQDYMPIYDAFPYDVPPPYQSTTCISIKVAVVSTMMDVEPIIPFYVFMSAGPDFSFFQPYPPGLFRVTELSKEEKARRKVIKVVEQQVQLPLDSQVQVSGSRYKITTDPGTLVSMPTVYDYMKIWSRCIPFSEYDDEEPVPDANIGFECASWYPPTTRSYDIDVNNSWYQTLDYIAYFGMQFMYYRGGIGLKIPMCTDTDVREQVAYLYATLGDPFPNYRQKTHTEYQYSEWQVPPQSNFGSGTVITPGDKQPLLECTIPYRGSNVLSYTNNSNYGRSPFLSIKNAGVDNNIVLLGEDNTLADAMFRKIAPDFVFDLETVLPPPTLWIARGSDWSLTKKKKKAPVPPPRKKGKT